MQTFTEGEALLPLRMQEKISRELEVFYNPKMERNRSISVALLASLEKNHLQIALPLAGSGVRAVRFAKELPHEKIARLACNDHSDVAVQKINELFRVNGLQKDMRLEVYNEDAEKFLMNSLGFDYIDIDPFGSPNFLLDIAIKRLSREGILAVTATDTGALAGSFVGAGKMKYWATNTNNAQKHELGLRILARKVMLIGMQHAKALTPVLSYHDQHYYRIFFKVQKGKTVAATSFESCAGVVAYCSSCGNYELHSGTSCSFCNATIEQLGPCYTGKLQSVVTDAVSKQDTSLEKFFSRYMLDDHINQVGFFDTHQLAKLHGKQLQKIDVLVGALKEQGFLAVQSAFEKTGIKTNASLGDVLNLM